MTWHTRASRADNFDSLASTEEDTAATERPNHKQFTLQLPTKPTSVTTLHGMPAHNQENYHRRANVTIVPHKVTYTRLNHSRWPALHLIFHATCTASNDAAVIEGDLQCKCRRIWYVTHVLRAAIWNATPVAQGMTCNVVAMKLTTNTCATGDDLQCRCHENDYQY